MYGEEGFKLVQGMVSTCKNVKVEWVNIFILPHQEFLLTLCFEYVF
jgi:hypothetical protein